MGHGQMKSKRTVKRQFLMYFTLTLGLSFIMTIVVWSFIFWAFFQAGSSFIRPANYYEKQMTAIRSYINEQGSRLLQQEKRKELENVIPLEGMDYAIYLLNGKQLYGTIQHSPISNQKQLLTMLNTIENVKANKIRHVHPLVDETDSLQGAIVLEYELAVSGATPELTPVVKIFRLMTVLLPFILVCVFAWIFGHRFNKQLNEPIQQLIEGTKRVQSRDLNFTFSYEGTQELTQLTQAFEDMRKALSDSLQREMHLVQERRDMVAALAHDLRTPLAIIQGHVEGLMNGGPKRQERLDSYLLTIQKNTQRAARMIGEINEVSEMEKPEFRLQWQDVDLQQFVRDKVSDYEQLCHQHRLHFLCSYEDLRQKRTTIKMDPDRIAQIVDNLVSNSSRFTAENGEIHWELCMTDLQWTMKVSDTGSGFSKSSTPFLFDKFYQEDRLQAQRKGHAGLGLYIVKLLTMKHGGTVEASNTPEGGAYVLFHFPIRSGKE
ncbi:ATP-binding protein [Brevibacillus laterosporus]|uniref:HAMP domain-containing sensor histidine kinase n=1 Tax=Brevibacillus laterosporus TaxID=1465 RepID=UPI0035A59888